MVLRPKTRPTRSRIVLTTLGVVGLLGVTACSAVGGKESSSDASKGPDQGSKEVVLVTHESFHLPEELLAKFTTETGYTLKVSAAGDAGVLATKLALNPGNPPGDAAFGIDNTYATRPLKAGAFADYDGPRPEGSQAYDLAGAENLVPIDTAAVCVNVDTTWFAAKKLAVPTSLDDLTKPQYKGLFVTPAPTSSSPGMAFLLATIAAKGKDWPQYWAQLTANGATVVKGWTEAYNGEFTQGGEKGTRPIVLSYDSSPAFTVSKDKKSSTTQALLDTCFNQVEYAGVLDGAKNPEGAKAAVEFLASAEVQAALPESMYVFPASTTVDLPADWATFAVRPTAPLTLSAEEIDQNREAWLTEWTDVATR